MSCDIGEATESLKNEQSSFSKLSIISPISQLILQSFCHFTFITAHELILQAFHHFTYITAHSPTLLLLYLHHSSFSNPSVASPTSQFILQPFFGFPYVKSSSLNSSGEPHMIRKRKEWLSRWREEYVGNVPISPLGTPFSSVHSSTLSLSLSLTHSHTHSLSLSLSLSLQMTKFQYVNSSTIELQIKNYNHE